MKQDRDFIEELIGLAALENAIDWVNKNLEPDDVFSDTRLRQWAVDNDMVDAPTE